MQSASCHLVCVSSLLGDAFSIASSQPVLTLLIHHFRRCGRGRPVRISLFLTARGFNASLEKFRHRTAVSYCYELQPDHRWESVANVPIAADLHVRLWFPVRAELGNRGRCERSSDSMP
jgi:hypothetical protein